MHAYNFTKYYSHIYIVLAYSCHQLAICGNLSGYKHVFQPSIFPLIYHVTFSTFSPTHILPMSYVSSTAEMPSIPGHFICHGHMKFHNELLHSLCN